jgi:hypothetical protein
MKNKKELRLRRQGLLKLLNDLQNLHRASNFNWCQKFVCRNVVPLRFRIAFQGKTGTDYDEGLVACTTTRLGLELDCVLST